MSAVPDWRALGWHANQTIEHFRNAGVARQKTPERLEVVDAFPRTAAGKVKKFELRDRLR
jgi:non-ribosomal peptide synthetase component E (peptide arylation enzyme)